MRKKLPAPLRCRLLAAAFAFGCAFAMASVRDADAQHASLFGDDYYCPASQHSCDFTGGTIPYFAPDPFDVGAGCDANFVGWDTTTGTTNPGTCYGECDHNNPTPECYTGCQDQYSSCLRGAFGLDPHPVPIGNPRNLPNISGNIYRSCLAGHVPLIYQDEYNSCIAGGGTVEDCCALVASHFP